MIRRLVPLLLCLLLLPSCARHVSFPLEPGSPGIELAEVAFFAQREYQCGPAALAMVLHHAGIEVQPDQLAPRLFVPGRRGSLQLEMVAAARRSGRIPFLLRPDPAAIQAELAAGRPVLVLQNLGVRWLPLYHYAVVIGILPGDRVVLRSGQQRRLELPGRRFAATWRRAGQWALVVLRPGELPATDEPTGYLKAVAAFERRGRYDIARRGYQAALARWPQETVARFGLANSLLAVGKVRQAIDEYSRLLALAPGHAAAVNNLAEALARCGCRDQALALLDRTLAPAEGGGSFRSTLQQTRAEIAARQEGGDSGTCPTVPAAP